MNKKIAFISFTVLAIFAFTVWAVTTNGPQSHHAADNAVNIEQVSAGNTPDCDPSKCTPEQAAKCPHPGMTETAATGKTEADCPPAKCENKKSNTATL